MNASEYSKRVGISDNCSIGSAPAFQRVQSTLVAVLNTHLGKFRMSHVVPSSSELDLLNAQMIELLELHPAFGKEARKERARRAMQLASRYVKPSGQPGASEGIIKKDSHSSKGSEEDVDNHPNSQEEVQGNAESSSKLQEAKNLLAGILKRELNGSAAAAATNGKSWDAPEHNASQESSMSGSSGLEEDAVVRYGNTQHRITNLLAQAIRKTQDSENNSLKEEKPGNTALSSVVQQIKDALQSETVNDALLQQTLASTVHSRKRKDRTEDDVAVHALMALNDATQETPSNVVA
ncbi:hypothetical protein M9434_000017 [Picochlorum sp. BPE23]|nr:hypothetical protein M9434_000017 [Picochlorum sp. BPE23]